jgi:hypothetical protein
VLYSVLGEKLGRLIKVYLVAEGGKGDVLGVITEPVPTVVSGEGARLEKCVKLWCLAKSTLLCLHAVSQ